MMMTKKKKVLYIGSGNYATLAMVLSIMACTQSRRRRRRRRRTLSFTVANTNMGKMAVLWQITDMRRTRESNDFNFCNYRIMGT
uniref:Uncharacterized protein n=1 Tax=Glossina palpalis gambiensis TaxID=67801 RepID=A0A1B0BI39_9MUSC